MADDNNKLEDRNSRGQFVKGIRPKGAGKSKLPEDIRKAKNLTKTTLIDLVNRLLGMKAGEFDRMMEDPEISMVQRLAASIINRGVNDGSVSHMGFLLKIVLGKNGFDIDDSDLNPPLAAPVQEQQGPVFLVEINQNGKFLRARPREQIIDVQPVAASGT